MHTTVIAKILLTIFTTSFLFSAFSESVERTCRIKSIVGSVKIRRNSTINWLDARVNMPVKERDAVRTFIESELELVTSEGTIIKVGENSTLEIEKLNQKENADNTKVKIMSGSVAANVKKLVNSKSTFEFETPTATAAIRGTIVGFEVNKEKTVVKVYEGTVWVAPQGSRNGSEIKDNQMTSVVKGQKNVLIEKLVEKSSLLLSSEKQDKLVVTDTTKVDTTTTKTDSTAVPIQPVKDSAGQVPIQTDSTTNIPRKDTTATIFQQSASAAVSDSIGSVKSTVFPKQPVDSQLVSFKKDTIETLAKPQVPSPTQPIPAATPVRVIVSSPADASIVKHGAIIPVSGTVSPSQATVSINGKPVSVSSTGAYKTTLTAPSQDGSFEIIVIAENGNLSQSVTRTVSIKQVQLQFSVSSPTEGQVFKKTSIPVSGTATPGAEVTVMSIKVPVSTSGTFSGQIPIANEEGEVYIEFEASLDGKFQNTTRKIVYEPEYRFTLLSPQDGQEVNLTTIQIRGEVLPVTSKVSVFNRSIPVSPTGIFTGTVSIPEEEGEVELDFEISSGVLVKNETHKIIYKKPPDIVRPEIQGSLPLISEQGKIIVTIYDRTPEDEIIFWYEIDGTKEFEKGLPNSSFTLPLIAGVHKYIIHASDKAGNQSNVLSQTITWFGSADWSIKVQKTAETLHLPPSGPGTDYEPVYTVEFSIDNLPDNDMRLIGSVSVVNKTTGETLTKKTFTDQYFTIDVKLKNHVVNMIDIIVEDIRNSVKTKTVVLTIR